MKRNNRGFTLIELVVATAILGIVVVGIFGFMTAGANSYRSVSSGVQLQTAAQQAMGQIQETVLDCSTAVYVPTAGDGLYLRSGDTVCAYVLGADNCLDYQQVDGPANEEAVTDSDRHLLSEQVTGFAVDTDDTDGDGKLTDVTITLTLSRDGKTYTGKQTIALRNTPQAVNSLERLVDVDA